MILITGANGLAGSAVIREFARQQSHIRALIRSRAKAQPLAELPAVEGQSNDGSKIGNRGMTNNETTKLTRLKILLRVYGVLTLIIFGSLIVGFAIQTPLLADEPRGALNWTIWNGIRCGAEPCFVPPMLFIIHIVWGVFFFIAARKPLSYVSFLSFTMWAYLAHGLLMTGQALTHMSTQWHRFFMDIPYELILALGIYLWRPRQQPEK